MANIDIDQISLNSVSHSFLGANGEWTNDFFGNDINYSHTTKEIMREAISTQPELSDFELYALQKWTAEDASIYNASLPGAVHEGDPK